MQKLLGDEVFEGLALINPESGRFMSSISDVDIYAGNVKGARPFSISGIKVDVSSAAYERIEPQVTVLPPFAGHALTIRSTSAADVGQVLVSMLGPNCVYAEPFPVNVNGTTPVSLGVGSRINSLWRMSGDFVGTVLVEGPGAQLHCTIQPGGQRDLHSRHCVPTNHRLHLESMNGSIAKPQGSSTSAVTRLTGKPAQSSGFGFLFAFGLNRDGSSSASPRQAIPNGVLGPFDLHFDGTAFAAGVDLQIFSSGCIFDLASFNKP